MGIGGAGLVLGVAFAALQAAAQEGLREVPRERTVIAAVDGNRGVFWNIWSMYNLGGTHQNGNSLMYEPLYFINGLGDRIYPWLAESHEYNDDHTELTYRLREGITWSDGVAFTAEDVAYTFNTLGDLGGSVPNGRQVAQFLDEAVVIDPLAVTLRFKQSAPKFHDFVAYKGDNGVFVVPRHVFEGRDWAEFTHFDPEQGFPVTTGAWRVAHADPTQRVIDRVASCEEWWGCRTGFMPLPAVERFILLTGLADTQRAQAMITGEIDVTRERNVETFKKIIADNPLAMGWNGKDAPFGMVSWWPTSLVFNNKDKHLSHREVRWALSHFVDRELTIDVAFSGAGSISRLPWPNFGGLKPFEDEIADLLEQYPTDRYDPARGAALLTEVGYAKDSEGFWADAAGDRIRCDILGFGIFADQGPVLAELLRRHGIEASYQQPPNAFELLSSGNFTCGINGHTGSATGDPYLSLALYMSAVPGAERGAVNHNPNNFYHYSNPDYDALVARLANTHPDDPETRQLVRQAMEIWLHDLPDAQLFDFLNRPIHSTQYWDNWPSAENPYMNGLMFMHMGTGVVLHHLQPAK